MQPICESQSSEIDEYVFSAVQQHQACHANNVEHAWLCTFTKSSSEK
jgi:hypothetical protein